MATKRSKSMWIAPRSGGYSAVKKDSEGRKSTGGTHRTIKQDPPKGRGAASIRSERGGDGG